MTPLLIKRIGLFGAPVLALFCYYALPVRYATGPNQWAEFSDVGRATLAMTVWMAVWWLTEAVDIEATALLPIVAFPLLGIAPMGEVLGPYASDVIFLFLGGFVIGLSIERWGLDRRMAFFILRLVGARPGAIVGGFMAVTAFLSMWVSNTACAAMMVPIALSVVDLVLRNRTGAGLKESKIIPEDRPAEGNFAAGLLLGIAYAASIGGVATIIGSPPNGIAVRYIRQTFGKGGYLLRLGASRGSFHAHLPADRVAPRDPGPVPVRHRRDRRRPSVLRRGVSRAGADDCRRADRARRVRGDCLPLDRQPAAQGPRNRGPEAAGRPH